MGAARLIIFLCLPAALSAEFVLQKRCFSKRTLRSPPRG